MMEESDCNTWEGLEEEAIYDPRYQGAAWNAMMEEESKESVMRMYFDASAREDALIKAMEDIKKHQAIIAGDAVHYTAVWRIADAALVNNERLLNS